MAWVTVQLYSNYQKNIKEAASPLSLIPAGLAIVAATYGLARYAYGLFLPYIQHDLALSTEVMGVIAGVSYMGYLVATILGSWISGLTGPRLPVVLGGLAATGGMALISTATSVDVLTIGVFLAGTSPGLVYPPLSDAVMRLIVEDKRTLTYAWINAGTGIGVIFAGPVALWAGLEWRSAWCVFALFALVATVWNGQLMPHGPYGSEKTTLPRLSWGWFIHTRSSKLLLSATMFGLASSVYWTFAVDLLTRHGALSANQATLFWVFIGVSGLLGGFAGSLVARFGLKRTFFCTAICTGGGVTLIVIDPGSLALVIISAAMFGATFILQTGLFGIWSINLFRDRPSAGFGAVFFLISFGQLIGPVVAGFLAPVVGLTAIFYGAGGLCALTALFAPKNDLFTIR